MNGKIHRLELHLCTSFPDPLLPPNKHPQNSSLTFLGVNLLPLHICHFKYDAAEFKREHKMSFLVSLFSGAVSVLVLPPQSFLSFLSSNGALAWMMLCAGVAFLIYH